MALRGSVLLPLYVYPSADAWQPLYNMYGCFRPYSCRSCRPLADQCRASNFPNVRFTAIVNPHSGPGSALPTAEYTQTLQTLHALTNVRTVGYVATTWCTKNLSSVLDEIALYAGWGSQDSSLSLSGIFFDEVASEYTPETIEYLKTVSRAVHNASGLAESYVGKHAFLIVSFRPRLRWTFHCTRSRWNPMNGSPCFATLVVFRVRCFCNHHSLNTQRNSHRQLRASRLTLDFSSQSGCAA